MKAQIKEYLQHLQEEERSEGTLQKYQRDLFAFAAFLGEREANKESVLAWKELLISQGYAPVTINSMLAAVNGLLKYSGKADQCVKFLKIQRRLFREEKRELSKYEYEKLLTTARNRKQERLHLLLETICSTGIRVSEVKYITVEAAEQGRTEISLKGKIRTILLPKKLCKKLLQYARKQKIALGEVFLTKSGKSLSRKQIWAEMKRLCKYAGVRETKVFPHNLRHLFATAYYKVYKDIAKLADLLGHSSIETTRVYLLTSGADHIKQLERLQLVL